LEVATKAKELSEELSKVVPVNLASQTAKRVRPTRGNLTFRAARSERHIPAIVELAREAQAESRFGYIPFSAEKVRKTAVAAMKDQQRHAVMLAFKKDPSGFFIALSGNITSGPTYC